MEIGFTGTRRGLTERQKSALQFLLSEEDWFTHGGCHGADRDADCIAEDIIGQKNRIHIRPGDKKQYRYWVANRDRLNVFSPKPYLERNKQIVDDSDVLVAAPSSLEEQFKGSGTWATIRYARKKGKPVFILDP